MLAETTRTQNKQSVSNTHIHMNQIHMNSSLLRQTAQIELGEEHVSHLVDIHLLKCGLDNLKVEDIFMLQVCVEFHFLQHH